MNGPIIARSARSYTQSISTAFDPVQIAKPISESRNSTLPIKLRFRIFFSIFRFVSVIKTSLPILYHCPPCPFNCSFALNEDKEEAKKLPHRTVGAAASYFSSLYL